MIVVLVSIYWYSQALWIVIWERSSEKGINYNRLSDSQCLSQSQQGQGWTTVFSPARVLTKYGRVIQLEILRTSSQTYSGDKYSFLDSSWASEFFILPPFYWRSIPNSCAVVQQLGLIPAIQSFFMKLYAFIGTFSIGGIYLPQGHCWLISLKCTDHSVCPIWYLGEMLPIKAYCRYMFCFNTFWISHFLSPFNALCFLILLWEIAKCSCKILLFECIEKRL